MALKQWASHYLKRKTSEKMENSREKAVWASPMPWGAMLAYQWAMEMGWDGMQGVAWRRTSGKIKIPGIYSRVDGMWSWVEKSVVSLPSACHIAPIYYLLPADNKWKQFYPTARLWRQVSHIYRLGLDVIKVWKQPTVGDCEVYGSSAVGIMSQREGIHTWEIKLVIMLSIVS